MYAWLWVMSSPISWEIQQVSWERGCFCLWFNPGRQGTNPENLPVEQPPQPPETPVCPSPAPPFPPSVESLQGGEPLLLLLCLEGEAVPGRNFTQEVYPISQLTALTPGLGFSDFVGGLAKEQGVFRKDT